MIGPESWRHLNQSDSILTSILIWTLAFSRVYYSLLVFTESFNWLMIMSNFTPIGSCSQFGFSFSNSNEDCSSLLLG